VDGRKSAAPNGAFAISSQLAQMIKLSQFPLPTKARKEQGKNTECREKAEKE
jgi:hypothetical protein